jgi:hypothetical protein
MTPAEVTAQLTAEVQTAGPALRAHLRLVLTEVERLRLERDEALRQLQELRQSVQRAIQVRGPPC